MRCWQRAAHLGEAHEARVLQRYLGRFGDFAPGVAGGVAQIAVPRTYDRASLEATQAETVAALQAGADVVFQGAFFDGRFHGRSDFLVRRDGAYAVYDTKLARHAKITALLQLAAYADQLQTLGIPVHEQVGLMLGDYDPDVDPVRGLSMHPVHEIIPVYRARRARLQALIDEHQAETGPVCWGDDRYAACGRCEVCAEEVAAHRDVLLVAGMRLTQRAHLHAAGHRHHRRPRRGRRARARRPGRHPGPAARAGRAAGGPGPAAAAGRRAARGRGRRLRHHRPGRPARPRPRRHLLRLRGRPAVVGGRVRRVGPGVPVRRAGGRHRRLPAVLGARPARGEGRTGAVPRLRHRPARGPPRHAHLPLRRLRAVRAAAAGRPPRRR